MFPSSIRANIALKYRCSCYTFALRFSIILFLHFMHVRFTRFYSSLCQKSTLNAVFNSFYEETRSLRTSLIFTLFFHWPFVFFCVFLRPAAHNFVPFFFLSTLLYRISSRAAETEKVDSSIQRAIFTEFELVGINRGSSGKRSFTKQSIYECIDNRRFEFFYNLMPPLMIIAICKWLEIKTGV